jgi:hypothetical protein
MQLNIVANRQCLCGSCYHSLADIQLHSIARLTVTVYHKKDHRDPCPFRARVTTPGSATDAGFQEDWYKSDTNVIAGNSQRPWV